MAKRSKKETSGTGGVVYSTELGRMCPECGEAVDACVCSQQTLPEGDGIVRINLDRKGRKGKGVTEIRGILLPEDALKKLAKELKQKCGVGGALKDSVIEIQGDQRDTLVALLEAKGYQVKRSGG